jgi:hypothetical protein
VWELGTHQTPDLPYCLNFFVKLRLRKSKIIPAALVVNYEDF